METIHENELETDPNLTSVSYFTDPGRENKGPSLDNCKEMSPCLHNTEDGPFLAGKYYTRVNTARVSATAGASATESVFSRQAFVLSLNVENL